MLWHSGHAVPADIKARVVAVLDRYFDAIQDTSAWRIYPDPTYAWRHYQGEAIEKTLDWASTEISGFMRN